MRAEKLKPIKIKYLGKIHVDEQDWKDEKTIKTEDSYPNKQAASTLRG